MALSYKASTNFHSMYSFAILPPPVLNIEHTVFSSSNFSKKDRIDLRLPSNDKISRKKYPKKANYRNNTRTRKPISTYKKMLQKQQKTKREKIIECSFQGYLQLNRPEHSIKTGG